MIHTPEPPFTHCYQDFSCFNALADAQKDHQPQIDPRTRLILRALLKDLTAHRDAYADLTSEPDEFMSIQVPISVLNGLLDGASTVSTADTGLFTMEHLTTLTNRSNPEN